VVLDVVVGLRWWCECGWISPHGGQGAAQIVREHAMTCSYANRRGEPVSRGWVNGLTIRGNGRQSRAWGAEP
jgi:hypothetical protein